MDIPDKIISAKTKHKSTISVLQYPVTHSPKGDINMCQEKHCPAESILQLWQNYLERVRHQQSDKEENLSK